MKEAGRLADVQKTLQGPYKVTVQWLLGKEREFGYLTSMTVTVLDEIYVKGKVVEERKGEERKVEEKMVEKRTGEGMTADAMKVKGMSVVERTIGTMMVDASTVEDRKVDVNTAEEMKIWCCWLGTGKSGTGRLRGRK